MDTLEAGGRTYRVARILTRNRTASASLKDGMIVLRIPSRWPEKEKERIGAGLLARAARSIASGRWKEAHGAPMRFSDGQRLSALGRDFRISLVPGKRFGSSLSGDMLKVMFVENHPQKDVKTSRLVRKRIVESVLPELSGRVHGLNRLHFNASLGRISVRENSSRWGSCSPGGSISLNFRLLFMPGEILDYVIIHELAHTRYRSHGVRFWALVEKAMPGHRECRRWLRENGWENPAQGGRDGGPAKEGAEGRERPDDGDYLFDEPY